MAYTSCVYHASCKRRHVLDMLENLAQLSNYSQHSVLSCLPNVPEWFLWTARGRRVQWGRGLAREEGGGGALPHRGRTVPAAAQAVLRSEPTDRENFLNPCCRSGSGIRCLFNPWIRDGLKIKIRIRDGHHGSYFREFGNNVSS
jgi:hypothetical protein